MKDTDVLSEELAPPLSKVIFPVSIPLAAKADFNAFPNPFSTPANESEPDVASTVIGLPKLNDFPFPVNAQVL
ncbi:hypothetical protein A9X74_12540 [Brachyspira hyodysenteriae]|nr:hypothetical protein A9X74_12540 [Brachyspira hyodysenteriae]